MNPVAKLIVQAANKYRVDPAAAIAVARQEGLGGGVGDNGTSFGPFQLHLGGAFPTGRVPRGQEQAWAMSPAGIDYALRHIGQVAGGLRGHDAIHAIVSQFERPADPQTEIARALAAYGSSGGAGTMGMSGVGAEGASGSVSSFPGPDAASVLLASLMGNAPSSQSYTPPSASPFAPVDGGAAAGAYQRAFLQQLAG